MVSVLLLLLHLLLRVFLSFFLACSSCMRCSFPHLVECRKRKTGSDPFHFSESRDQLEPDTLSLPYIYIFRSFFPSSSTSSYKFLTQSLSFFKRTKQSSTFSIVVVPLNFLLSPSSSSSSIFKITFSLNKSFNKFSDQ